MEKTDARQAMKELTLALLFLTRIGDHAKFSKSKEFYAWRGYDFGVIDRLEQAGYLDQGNYPRKMRIIHITKEGLEQGARLLEKYGIKDIEYNIHM